MEDSNDAGFHQYRYMYTHTLAYLTLCSRFYPLNKTVLKIRLICQSSATTLEEQWLYKKLFIISLKKKPKHNKTLNVISKLETFIPQGKSRFTVTTTCQIHLKTDLTESPKPSESSILKLCTVQESNERFIQRFLWSVLWRHVPQL